MRVRALTVSVALAAGGIVGVATPAAAADSAHLLALTNVRDVLVDDAHGRVFLTGGGSQGLVVRTTEGAAVTTVENLPGADEMVLSPDGTQLYVALAHGDAVAAVDPVTLTETARYPTGAATCPSSVAAVGTTIWFGYGCATGTTGNVGVIDLAGEEPVVTLDRAPAGTWSATPRIAMSPAVPGRLLAAQRHVTTGVLYAFAVADGALTTAASREIGHNISDLALTPDGQHVVTASGSPHVHPRYRTSDLSSDGVYGTHNPYPVAVAVAQTGHVAAGVNAYYDPDVYVYAESGSFRRRYETSSAATGHQIVFTAGMAFSADASRLYVATYEDNSPSKRVFLQVLRDPTKARSAITLTKPATAKVKTAFTMTGKLTAAVPVTAGTPLHVKRTSPAGTVTRRADVAVAADGTFKVTDTAGTRGSYAYTVWWNGDADHDPASRTITFTVLGLTPALSMITNARAYQYPASARILARLGTTAGSRKVTIAAFPLDGPNRTLVSANVDAEGFLRTTHAPHKKTTYVASFAGDSVYEPRRVTRTVGVYPRVTQRLSGYYGTSNGYYLYRRTADPVVTARVEPRSYACFAMTVQRYEAGAWRTVAEHSCVAVTDEATAAATIAGDPRVGAPYRVQSRFVGNTYHLPATTAWTYLKFT